MRTVNGSGVTINQAAVKAASPGCLADVLILLVSI
jgi:hypothetical protein